MRRTGPQGSCRMPRSGGGRASSEVKVLRFDGLALEPEAQVCRRESQSTEESDHFGGPPSPKRTWDRWGERQTSIDQTASGIEDRRLYQLTTSAVHGRLGQNAKQPVVVSPTARGLQLCLRPPTDSLKNRPSVGDTLVCRTGHGLQGRDPSIGGACGSVWKPERTNPSAQLGWGHGGEFGLSGNG